MSEVCNPWRQQQAVAEFYAVIARADLPGEDTVLWRDDLSGGAWRLVAMRVGIHAQVVRRDPAFDLEDRDDDEDLPADWGDWYA